ncbi:MAG TPA: putative toxin-antitoxin system toxin component, PIN family [Dehalococcoidia bacterium]|nr:putative toxin-antitoxin system toxin component, PIN family [Dehalococcoidia bacterium]
MRIFLDTNVLISAYIARGICADLLRHILAEHALLTGEVNLAELRRVLADRFRAPAAQLSNIDAELRAQTVIPKPEAPGSLSVRDPDDAWVLASAIAGAADMLVTGDLDLLSVAQDAPLPIVTPRGCWERLRRSE